MSSAFNSIKQGLTEAIDFADGVKNKAIVHEFSPVDVKAIRDDIGMSQPSLLQPLVSALELYDIGNGGIENLRGPALVLLNIVKKNPSAVLQALSAG
jgi:putative transcriptional regulator